MTKILDLFAAKVIDTNIADFQAHRQNALVPFSVSIPRFIEMGREKGANSLEVVIFGGSADKSGSADILRLPFKLTLKSYRKNHLVYIREQPLLSAYYSPRHKQFTDPMGIFAAPDYLMPLRNQGLKIAGYAIQQGYESSRLLMNSPPELEDIVPVVQLTQEKMDGFKPVDKPKFFVVEAVGNKLLRYE